MDISKIFCFLGLHSWYYGDFQTGKISKWTEDNVGVRGRSCLNCPKKQITKYDKNIKKSVYVDVDSFEGKDNG